MAAFNSAAPPALPPSVAALNRKLEDLAPALQGYLVSTKQALRSTPNGAGEFIYPMDMTSSDLFMFCELTSSIAEELHFALGGNAAAAKASWEGSAFYYLYHHDPNFSEACHELVAMVKDANAEPCHAFYYNFPLGPIFPTPAAAAPLQPVPQASLQTDWVRYQFLITLRNAHAHGRISYQERTLTEALGATDPATSPADFALANPPANVDATKRYWFTLADHNPGAAGNPFGADARRRGLITRLGHARYHLHRFVMRVVKPFLRDDIFNYKYNM